MSEVTEQFADRQGRFLNYDAYDPAVREAIREKSHVDLRSFRQNDITRRLTIFEMNQFTMAELNAMTMAQLDSLTTTVQVGEHWTNGTVAPQADRSNLLGLSLPVNGTATTQSVMTDQPVDITTGFASTDVLSIALPAFPKNALNLGTTVIQLTSNPSGDFTAGPTVSIPFSASTTTLVNGDSEFTVPLSAVTTVDKTKITGVRFTVVSTSAVAFRVTALRVLNADWTYSLTDIDTRFGLLRRTPARNGSLAAYAYTQPTLWRSGILPGSNDPKPINTKMGTTFNTGSMGDTGRISLFFREGSEDFMTQLDLNGMTMEELNGNPQPNYVAGGFATRPQSDLDVHSQDELEGIPQTTLERSADALAAHWIEFKLEWGGGAPALSILSSENVGYPRLGTPVLVPNTNYLLVTELVDTTARIYLYTINEIGAIVDTVFDSGLIYDSFLFKRIKGRFGWYVNLTDGDAFVDNISSRGLIFAEFRTRPLESITPVVGIELFAAGSSPIQMFENLGIYSDQDSGTVLRDKTRSTTGESWKVTNPGTLAIQGIKSNPLQFTDLENAKIFFDLFIPQAVAETAPVSSFLLSNTGVWVPLIISRIVPDQWQTHHATISDLTIQTGTYQLVVVQTTQGVPSTWWIDNVRIYERTLRWQGRIDPDDPWDEADTGWIDFEDLYNRESAGIMFAERGTRIQVRSQALNQEAFMDRVKVRPRYAELGRLVTPGSQPLSLPTASFAFTDLGTHIGRFTASASSEMGRIIAYEWAFGDGQVGYGSIADHEYSSAGVYSVNLIVTDNSGNRVSSIQSVTVA